MKRVLLYSLTLLLLLLYLRVSELDRIDTEQSMVVNVDDCESKNEKWCNSRLKRQWFSASGG